METILCYLNNASFAAFFGAFCAFLLVALTDWWRNWGKRRLIFAMIADSIRLATDKLEAIERNRRAASENKFSRSPTIRFSTEEIRRLKLEALQRFSHDERIALDALCFIMQGTDEILDDIRGAVQSLGTRRRLGEEIGGDDPTLQQIMEDYGRALANLRRFIDQAKSFVDKNAPAVLGEYRRSDYES